MLRPLLALSALAALSSTALGQQIITYSDGENNASPIVITDTTDPTTLSLSSGSATQSGAISESSGTTGDVDVDAGSGTITLTVSNSYTGSTTIDFGTLAVSGPGAAIDSPNADVYVGNADGDNGSLAISSEGQVTDDFGYVGYDSGSTGNVTVTGSGSNWNNSASIVVGFEGTSSLTVSSGGQVTDAYGYVGYASGGTGSVTVTGPGSSWSNSIGLPYVGYAGTGSLTISDGGTVAVNDGNGTLTLAKESGSTGTLNIGNGNSAGILEAAVVTGGSGTAVMNFDETDSSYSFAPQLTGSLSVNQTGSGTTVLGADNTYTGNTTIDFGTLAVSGTGAAIDSPNADIYVGNADGDNGSLTISSGGQVTDAYGYIGSASGSTGGVTVAGTGSSWSNSYLVVGDGTGSLTISSGGLVTDIDGYVGDRYGGTGSGAPGGTGNVTVTGSGSSWSNSDGLFVGYVGTGSLTISDGGTVTVNDGNGTLTLAKESGSTGTLNIGDGGPAGTLEAATVTGGSGTAVANFDETDSYSSYTFAPQLTGSLSVNQTGSGTTVLKANNTYSGGTSISNGSIFANNSTSSLGTGAVMVGSDGTLGGSGVIAPSSVTSGTAVDVHGTLSPGASGDSVGTLTFNLAGTSTVTLEKSVQLVFDLGTNSGQIDISGGDGLSLNGLSVSEVTVNQESGFGDGTYVLVDSANGITGSLGGPKNGEQEGSYNYRLEVTGDDLDVVVTSVPEPGTIALLGLSALALIASIRRPRPA